MDDKKMDFPTFESFKSWFDEKTKNHPFKTGKERGRFYDDLPRVKSPGIF